MKVLVTENFRYASGQVASEQLVDVFVRGTLTRALLFADGAGAVSLSNPIRTDGIGNLSFYVEEGSYDFSAFGVKLPFDVEDLTPTGTVDLDAHINSPTPHPAYDDMPSVVLLFENGLV